MNKDELIALANQVYAIYRGSNEGGFNTPVFWLMTGGMLSLGGDGYAIVEQPGPQKGDSMRVHPDMVAKFLPQFIILDILKVQKLRYCLEYTLNERGLALRDYLATSTGDKYGL